MNISCSQRRTWLTVMMAALLAACSSGPKVRADQDSHANFANYKTFTWLESKPAADESVEANTLVAQRARASLSAALQAKGYTLDEARPDVRVSYVLNVYERPKQSGLRLGIGAGGGSGNVAGGVGVSLPVGKRKETVAAMTVDVFDAARNAPVWHGSSEKIVSGENATDADVQSLTDSILSKYPSQKK